jgi:hypothetical protein
MTFVVRHDHFGSTADGRCDDVAVFRVIGLGAHERCVTRHLGIAKVLS